MLPTSPPPLPLCAQPSEADLAARAVLLCWFAAKNKSLLAAQCFVETAAECYLRGVTIDELQARRGAVLFSPSFLLLRPPLEPLVHCCLIPQRRARRRLALSQQVSLKTLQEPPKTLRKPPSKTPSPTKSRSSSSSPASPPAAR